MLRNIRKKLDKNGFTLVELVAILAVIAIIAAIAAIAIPIYANIIENTKLKADISTAAQIGRSAEIYAMEQGLEDIDVNLLAAEEDETLSQFVKDYLREIDPQPRKKGTFSVKVSGGKASVTWKGLGVTEVHNYYVNGQVRSYSSVKANPQGTNL